MPKYADELLEDTQRQTDDELWIEVPVSQGANMN